ncbi:hypothetical protein BGI30_04385 [Snodgrassella alvi]|jgi:predicted short-subunit dehydrogenase-like oxidoreductase (DUF2520 family)|uniref:Rossmann-like and DUF2520 domain-containing protein n=1 Tax=Snodgrassella alvi TaxID=1196083 RepID=UPI000C1E0794|nr:Rossmann-like and DUF2520 domain-containing protein [Snodgrassella alvi]PIT11158.1 hypothetical protein BGI30_04385 [Snodgrassella alvi]PIT27561.1 hypothetical protein BGI37_03600 [Snodgrassella alvi]PIT55343.1 hypothetical protein BHC59_10800 [Snodgrassella alvi]
MTDIFTIHTQTKKSSIPRINIIGTGKVASTLAVIWHQSKQVSIQAAWNRSFTAAQHLKNYIPHIQLHKQLHTLPPADILAIGVSDQAIETISKQINQADWITADTLILHFSGALSSKVLVTNKQKALTGSLHPVFAFAKIETAINTLAGHLCAIEGDSAALPILQQLAQIAKLNSFNIDACQKNRYHAALTISANFLVTLNAYARNILTSLSLPQNLAEDLVNQLMQQNLDQLKIMSPAEALTGPIKRGDSNTIAHHWQALKPSEQIIYKALAEQTLNLSTLSKDKYQQILQILSLKGG